MTFTHELLFLNNRLKKLPGNLKVLSTVMSNFGSQLKWQSDQQRKPHQDRVLLQFCACSARKVVAYIFASERSGFNFKVNTKEMLFSMNGFSVTAPASLEAKADTRKILSIFDKKQGMGIGRSNILD